MGLFSKKGQTTKLGPQKVAWPKESGFGVGPYELEAQAQGQYLIYTSQRRATENVPIEDMPVMHAANSLLYEMAAGTPLNELPLIQGPVDINWISAPVPVPFPAEILITDTRVIVWWPNMRGIDGQLMIFHHFDVIPRTEVLASFPFNWGGGIRVRYPFSNPLMAARMPRVGVTIGVHFSNDGHANRRSMSVHATLLHLEAQARAGKATPEFRL
jgi:hypothetical protein